MDCGTGEKLHNPCVRGSDVLGKAGMRLQGVASPCSQSVLRDHRQPSGLAMALRFSRLHRRRSCERRLLVLGHRLLELLHGLLNLRVLKLRQWL